MDITLCKIVKFYLKLKHLLYIFILTCLFTTKLQAHTNHSTKIFVGTDDSTATSMPKDTNIVKPKPRSAIGSTIKYNARDSIRFNVVNQIVRLYGDAVVDYGTFELKAGFIEINWRTNTLTATYLTDSTNNKKLGIPLFKQSDDQYTANVIKYNYKTKKGFISEIVTQEGEGYLKGQNAYKDENDNLLIENAKYTTCNLEDPHYHFRLRKTKVIPNKRVITNFFNLYIEDIPLPLGLPFGIFPLSEKKSSGLIMPTYGQSNDRGFYLREGGYYWAISDYVDMKFLGEIYANGGGGIRWLTNYKSRYRFTGNLRLNYRNVVRNGDEYTRNEVKDYEFTWRHQPLGYGGRKLSADVNIASSTYNSNLTTNTQQNITNTLTSNITYSLPLKGTPFNATIKLRHEQNNRTKEVNFTLPSINVSMTQQYPFRAFGKNHVGGKSSVRKFYESISVGYGMNTEHRISTKGLSKPSYRSNFDLSDTTTIDLESSNFGKLLDRGKIGASHNIPIGGTFSAGSFTFSPKFNYQEYWYQETNDYQYNSVDSSVIITNNEGFARAYQYNASLTTQTRLYGMYEFIGKHETQVRHIINPSVSLTYTPDFQDEEKFGYYQRIKINEKNDSLTFSRYQNAIYGSGFSSKSASVRFNLNNVLEMKRKVFAKDSTEKSTYKKIKLLDQFNLSSSYNFIADSLRLNPIRITGVTNLFNFFNIQANATLQPYVYDSTGGTQRRIDTYAWDVKEGINKIGKFENVYVSVSTSLNPQARKKKYDSPLATEDQLDYINANANQYVDFSIPWNARISYTYNYRKIGFSEKDITQSLQVGGDFNLTPNWKVDASFAYDFINEKLTYPRVNLIRDLHCWEMRLNWVPFGEQQSFEFNIGVKAQVLQDLKLSRRRQWIDR